MEKLQPYCCPLEPNGEAVNGNGKWKPYPKQMGATAKEIGSIPNEMGPAPQKWKPFPNNRESYHHKGEDGEGGRWTWVPSNDTDDGETSHNTTKQTGDKDDRETRHKWGQGANQDKDPNYGKGTSERKGHFDEEGQWRGRNKGQKRRKPKPQYIRYIDY